MSSKKSYILSILSGLLLALAFPPFGFSFVAWLALVPLLVAVASGAGNPFVQGLLAGVVFRTLTMSWIAPMLHGYAQASWVVSVGAFALLISYLSCYTGAFAWAIRKVVDRWGPAATLLAPLFWVSLEYGNAHLFTGFHWNPLSASQAHHLRLVQIAEFTGAYGVSFLVVLVNTALFLLLSAWLRGPLGVSRRLGLVALGITGILLAVTCWWGEGRLRALEREEDALLPLRVRLVNPAVPQDVKWTLGHYGPALEELSALSRGAPKGTDLIVWPEAALPFFFEQDTLGAKAVYDLSKALQAPILFGAPGQRQQGGRLSFTNSAYLVTPNGALAGRYDKRRLVPFGEYVPLRPLLPFIPAVARGLAAGDLAAGESADPLTLKRARLGVLICYESSFEFLGARTRAAGANILVNLTNDAWLPPYGVRQHFAMSRLRAVEERVPMVRAANRGIGAVIGMSGKATCVFDSNRRAARDCLAKIEVASTQSTISPSAFPIGCVIISVFLVWIAWIQLQRKSQGLPLRAERGLAKETDSAHPANILHT